MEGKQLLVELVVVIAGVMIATYAANKIPMLSGA